MTPGAFAGAGRREAGGVEGGVGDMGVSVLLAGVGWDQGRF